MSGRCAFISRDENSMQRRCVAARATTAIYTHQSSTSLGNVTICWRVTDSGWFPVSRSRSSSRSITTEYDSVWQSSAWLHENSQYACLHTISHCVWSEDRYRRPTCCITITCVHGNRSTSCWVNFSAEYVAVTSQKQVPFVMTSAGV